MPFRLRCIATLFLLIPLLCRADPHYGLENLFWVLLVGGGLVLTVTALSIVLTVLSYRQPHRLGLYRTQLVLLAINALAALALSLLSPGWESLLPLPFNPYWGLGLPLGLWLNGVRWARQASTIVQCRVWIGVAVSALGLLLGVPAYLVLFNWLGHYNASPYAGQLLPQALTWLLAVAVVLGSWLIVVQQLRAQLVAAVWRPWWWLPLLTAELSVAFTAYGSWINLVPVKYHYLDKTQQLYALGQMLLMQWVLGVVALRILRPAYYPAEDNQ